jgi:hypothetical protein
MGFDEVVTKLLKRMPVVVGIRLVPGEFRAWPCE